MFWASLLLALGSAFLLAGGALGADAAASFAAFYLLTAFGLLFHAWAWTVLSRALHDGGRTPEVGKAQARKAMRGAFYASLAGFAVGMLTLPLAFPDNGWFRPTWAYVIFLGFFPYVSSVFGPVALAHGVLFSFGSRSVLKKVSFTFMVAGSGFLGLVAAIGIVGQLFFPAALRGLVWSLSGLTSFGYGSIAVGWLREYKAHENRNVLGGPLAT